MRDKKGRFLTDYCGFYESLEIDFNHVCKRIGINTPTLPDMDHPQIGFADQTKGRNDFGDYREHYTGEMVTLMNEMYAVDLGVFG
ncbi:unnamed protein product, partial [marine sediment metagenome]